MRHYFLIMKSKKKGPKDGGAIEFSFPISLMIKWAFKSSKEVTPITMPFDGLFLLFEYA